MMQIQYLSKIRLTASWTSGLYFLESSCVLTWLIFDSTSFLNLVVAKAFPSTVDIALQCDEEQLSILTHFKKGIVIWKKKAGDGPWTFCSDRRVRGFLDNSGLY
jgi:hypothetical protein